MLELPLKVPPLKKILEFQNKWKDHEICTKKENFKPKIKPVIENLSIELYQTSKQKVLNFMLTLDKGWRAKKAPKLSSEHLKDRMCKFKQYLSDILMIINQNILGTFLKPQKKLWKSLNQANFQSWISEFRNKIPNMKKISNEHFNLCQAEISLDEIIKFW